MLYFGGIFLQLMDKNILVNFGSGLWDTYGTAAGILGDVFSYIRLFAIGLTECIGRYVQYARL